MTPFHRELTKCRAILLTLKCEIPPALDEAIEKSEATFKEHFMDWIKEQENVVDYNLCGERRLKRQMELAKEAKIASKVAQYKQGLLCNVLRDNDLEGL